MSTTLFQFKGATDIFEYSSVDYPEVYIITQSTWVIIDLSILTFGHLLDLVSKVYMNAIYAISRPDLFDYFEIRLSQAAENAANIDALTKQTVKDEGNVVGNVRTFNFVGEGVTATLDPSDITDSTALITIANGKAGFVCITNITPTSPSNNVGSYEYDNSGIAMTSCRSSTANVDVEVLAVTGLQTLKPEVVVNGG